jgi:hypothetical protein
MGSCKDGEVKLDEDTPRALTWSASRWSPGRGSIIKWACKKTKWNCCASRVVSPEVLLA